ncbi:hypothetical protein ACFV16_13050 [Streptomyces massasporeus]|uniref:hypothetical protein n=1 Tax=Streptomyces massasporeus TaxID=67324 RepID=UPI0036974301
MTRGAQGLARVAVVVRAGAALFVLATAVVACARRKRYAALAAAASRAGKHDVLQDRAVTVRNWRRGHRWWLLLAFLAALGSAFAVPAAGGMLLAGCGAGLWLKSAWLGRREQTDEALLWVRVDWLRGGAAHPTGKRVKAYRSTGIAAGDASPGGARRKSPTLV